MHEKQEFVADWVGEKVSGWNIVCTAAGSILTLSFGYYTAIFAMAGGIFWLWAIPYAVLTAAAGLYTIWSGMGIIA